MSKASMWLPALCPWQRKKSSATQDSRAHSHYQAISSPKLRRRAHFLPSLMSGARGREMIPARRAGQLCSIYYCERYNWMVREHFSRRCHNGDVTLMIDNAFADDMDSKTAIIEGLRLKADICQLFVYYSISTFRSQNCVVCHHIGNKKSEVLRKTSSYTHGVGRHRW